MVVDSEGGTLASVYILEEFADDGNIYYILIAVVKKHAWAYVKTIIFNVSFFLYLYQLEGLKICNEIFL